jgi:hypothetical protein
MRGLLVIVLLLVPIGWTVLYGLGEIHHPLGPTDAEKKYEVTFARPGDECSRRALNLDTMTGDVLRCGLTPAPLTDDDREDALPGFSGPQYEEVIALSTKLGADGLSATDQRAIQRRVYEIAGVPPLHEGPRPGWLLAGIAAAVALAAVAAWRMLGRPLSGGRR